MKKFLFVSPFADGNLTRTSASGNLSLNLHSQSWAYEPNAEKRKEGGPLMPATRADGSATFAKAKAIVVQLNGSHVKTIVDSIGAALVEGFDLNAWFAKMGFPMLEAIVTETTTQPNENAPQKMVSVKQDDGTFVLTDAFDAAGAPIYRTVALYDVALKKAHTYIQDVQRAAQPQDEKAQLAASLAGLQGAVTETEF